MAIIAAMKNVLSPISDTRITDKDAKNACRNPTLFPPDNVVIQELD